MSLESAHQEQTGVDVVSSAPSTSQVNVFATILRFLHLVRLRKATLIAWLAVSIVGGAAFYTFAPRLYDSTATIYVIRAEGSNNINSSLGDDQVDVQKSIANHVRIISSPVVLSAALEQIGPDYRIDLEGVREESWPVALAENLVVNYERNSSMIDLRYRSLDPVAAKEIVTAILDAYLKFVNTTTKEGADKDVVKLLADRDEIAKQIQATSQDLFTYRENYGNIITTDSDSTIDIGAQRIIELNQDLTAAEKKRREAEAFQSAVSQAIANKQDLTQFAVQSLDGIGSDLLRREFSPSQQDSIMTNRMVATLLDDYAERQSLQQIYGSNHPDVQNLNNQILTKRAYLETQESERLRRLRDLKSTQLAPTLQQFADQRIRQTRENEQSIRMQVDSARAEFDQHGPTRIQIQQLETELTRLTSFQQSNEERISHALSVGNNGLETTPIRFPQVARMPSSPKLMLVGSASLFIGLFFGLATIYVIDVLDDRFRSPEELRMQIGAPVLAMVRQMDPTNGTGADAIHTHAKPNAVETEAFRSLRTSISFSDGETRRLMVTSSEPGDGKTTVMANLSVAFAQSGKRTLLIDADMRRPGMSTMLEKRGREGLSQILRDEASIEQSVQENIVVDVVEGLDFIPSGTRPINPAELLSSDRFSELLAWAETVYDQILIDAPPILAVSDPAIIGRMVDGVVLVIRPDQNRRKMVIRAADSLTTADINLLGIAVNRVSGKNGGDYYGYGYGYEYGYGYGYGKHGYGNDKDDDAAIDDSVVLPISAGQADESSESERIAA
jgi:succinoglycan biosynthesis transport protein ExoP